MKTRSTIESSGSRRLAGVAVLGAALLALACGSDEGSPGAAEPAAAPAPAETAAPGDPPAEPSGPAAEPSGPPPVLTASGMPDGYPDDVPTYPGSVPGPSINMPGSGLFATFEADAAFDDVVEFFRNELEGSGWEVSDVGNRGLDAIKDGRSLVLRMRTIETGTEIAINIPAS